MTRRDEAIAQLREAGAVFGQAGDVRALKEAIVRSAINRKPLAFNPANQCQRKRRYDTEDQAVKMARRTENPELRPYRCVHCHGWHNGNPPKAGPKPIRS